MSPLAGRSVNHTAPMYCHIRGLTRSRGVRSIEERELSLSNRRAPERPPEHRSHFRYSCRTYINRKFYFELFISRDEVPV